MKRFMYVVTVITAISFLVAGCSNPKEQRSVTMKPVTNVSADNPSWSQDKTPYTLKWFIAYDWYGKTFNPKLNEGDKKLLEETGITLEITVGNTEKLNLLISTGDLPDIVTMDGQAPQRKLLEDGGVLLDLDSLAAQYAPDLNVPQSMKDWYRAADGKWYAVTCFYYGPERTNADFGGYYVTHDVNYVRTDILPKIGMTKADMQTKSGFLNALRAIKSQNIRYDGQPMVPYTYNSVNDLAAQFGADLEDKDGKLVNIRRTPEYVEAIEFLNTMFREGLLTDEQFTQTSTQRDQKVSSGLVFAATALPTVENPREALYSLDPNAKIEYVGPIQGGDRGKSPVLEAVNCGGWTGTMITKNCKNPAKAIQFISYMTSEDATIAAYYGTNGYDIIDGLIVQKPEVKQAYADNYQTADAKYNMQIQFFVDWTIIEKYQGWEPDAPYYDNDHYNANHEMVYLDGSLTMYDNKAFTFVLPDDGTDLSIMRVRVEDYWEQQEPKMIMASSAAECSRIYQESITRADEIGMKDVDTFQNTKFQDNKKRLGYTRLWPR
jgi:putative aldouronate transport system substrate-binding protein